MDDTEGLIAKLMQRLTAGSRQPPASGMAPPMPQGEPLGPDPATRGYPFDDLGAPFVPNDPELAGPIDEQHDLYTDLMLRQTRQPQPQSSMADFLRRFQR